MDSEGGVRWLVALIVAVAIVALVLLARGQPERTPRKASSPVAVELRI